MACTLAQDLSLNTIPVFVSECDAESVLRCSSQTRVLPANLWTHKMFGKFVRVNWDFQQLRAEKPAAERLDNISAFSWFAKEYQMSVERS